MGPTASGKTDLAIALSEALPCDLISVDSALVYRGLDIGSAKPDAETLRVHPHALIDIRAPTEIYSAADFRRDALADIETSLAKGRTPVLVGGTMMYFKALLEGLAEMPGADAEVRAEIEALAAKQGWPAVHAALAAVDPEMAAQIHPNHSQRLSRALEVYRVSGITMSQWRRQQAQTSLPFQPLQFAIAPDDRAELHRRIELRLKIMFDQGFVDEVRGLMARGDLHLDLPSMRAVGYRQVWQYLQGECDLEEAFERALIASRQLAKRQLTWLRSWPQVQWLPTPLGTKSEQDEIISHNLAQIQQRLAKS